MWFFFSGKWAKAKREIVQGFPQLEMWLLAAPSECKCFRNKELLSCLGPGCSLNCIKAEKKELAVVVTFARVFARIVQDDLFDPKAMTGRFKALPTGRHTIAVLKRTKRIRLE